MRLLLGLAPLALLAVLATPAFAGTVSISGHGEVTAAPDTAYINSGVTTQAATAREALDANSKAMAELLATLKKAGVDAKDIQTSGFSVSPNYVYSDQRDDKGYSLPAQINGYQVSNSVTVRVRAVDQLGSILDQSVSIGANTVSGISFTVADPSKLLDEARKQAFADAQQKGALYATAAGTSLADVVSINEGSGNAAPQPYLAKAMSDMAPRAEVPVAAGELSFAIDVAVEWNLAPAH